MRDGLENEKKTSKECKNVCVSYSALNDDRLMKTQLQKFDNKWCIILCLGILISFSNSQGD